MVTLISFTVLAVASFIADASCQRLILPTSAYSPTHGGPKIILPTYRPPPLSEPIIRTVREVNNKPQWLWKGDNIPRAPATGEHPVLPPYIDDIKLDPNRRYTRSVDSSSAKRHGSHSSGSGRRDTGLTHPGHNRRNVRNIRLVQPDFIDPLQPSRPTPYDPFRPRPRHPLKPYTMYLRQTRDIQFPGVKKPSYRDVVIPNWNPNVRTNPWNKIVGRGRNPRSAGVLDNEEDVYLGYNREAS